MTHPLYPGRIIYVARWTITPDSRLMYDGRTVADMRYSAATQKQREFILITLNAAEKVKK